MRGLAKRRMGMRKTWGERRGRGSGEGRGRKTTLHLTTAGVGTPSRVAGALAS